MNNVRVLLKQENSQDCLAEKLVTVQLHLQSSELLSWDLICQNSWKQNFIPRKEFSPLTCKSRECDTISMLFVGGERLSYEDIFRLFSEGHLHDSLNCG